MFGILTSICQVARNSSNLARHSRAFTKVSLGENRLNKAIEKIAQVSIVSLEEKALKLIFGTKDYTQFTNREKKIVDAFQRRLYRENGFVMPNTGAAQEPTKSDDSSSLS